MSKYLNTTLLKLSASLLILALSISGYSGRVYAEAADRDKPIDLEADSVKVDDAKHTSTYFGNVILTKGTIIIHADKLIVREDQEGFQHSSSFGNPTTFKQKREGKNEYIEGSSQRIEYDARMDKVQLYTKAWVKRGEDIVHGDYIMYDANAEYAEVVGGGQKSATAGVPSGRVRAIIQPKNKQAPDAGADNTKINNNAKPAPTTAPNNNGATLKDSRSSQSLNVSGEGK
ncbi:MAG: hypothetical protein RL063_1495 [Pseudomonadota bacterium]|jgi:lipopolysaccharide export system protein LptA